MLAPFLLTLHTCGSHTTVFTLVFGESFLIHCILLYTQKVCEYLSLYPDKVLTTHLSWEMLYRAGTEV